ncbi:hypothetical protein [Lyngbya sp. PCC 8106]|uniref:hypothetical protein n=1 Tax=Lyngbya sp. (strain PCC 8106) TaxID=313612 RepID=UPI000310005F|nr:hypothetical protein [Lyngbya sp. PCC 8106]
MLLFALAIAMHNRETSSTPSQTSTDWWKIAEYSAVVGSTIGSIVTAAWYKQILYAATPISAALWLNLINRQRFEQQVRQYSESAIADVHTVVQSLQEQVQNIPAEPTELDPITEVLTELQRVTQSLEHDVIRQQDWEVINVRLKLIEEAVEAVKQTPVSDHVPLTSDYSTDPLESDITPLVSSDHEGKLHVKINQLHRQIVKLDQQNRDVVKPYLIRLTKAIDKLQNTQKN